MIYDILFNRIHNEFFFFTFKTFHMRDSHPWSPVTTAWSVPSDWGWGLDLQMWRLAANISNKQSWTVDQEWSST